ncbi:hypothetical protein MLD38_020057 [Melastoma candidum]|uniref:Uncharacterized protein n=1 Tax=Melastoma candidum TaxID=119954 RepID=A0ACB9QBY0_9MYRT|nr:hypothetical protein MLD38_020057 [Melastoma candidum]
MQSPPPRGVFRTNSGTIPPGVFQVQQHSSGDELPQIRHPSNPAATGPQRRLVPNFFKTQIQPSDPDPATPTASSSPRRHKSRRFQTQPTSTPPDPANKILLPRPPFLRSFLPGNCLFGLAGSSFLKKKREDQEV